VLILPQLEERELFEEYDFSEPWNGPNNRKLIDKMPQVFACPESLKHGQSNSATSYLAVIGPGTAWSENSMDRDGSAENSRILVAEVAHSRLKWTEPDDLTLAGALRGINVPGGACISSMHSQGANVAMSDGSIQFLSADLSPEELELLLTGRTASQNNASTAEAGSE
jgi:prepilin-type processing-associated H-X9-DG protein